jgi:hypothetical protein
MQRPALTSPSFCPMRATNLPGRPTKSPHRPRESCQRGPVDSQEREGSVDRRLCGCIAGHLQRDWGSAADCEVRDQVDWGCVVLGLCEVCREKRVLRARFQACVGVTGAKGDGWVRKSSGGDGGGSGGVACHNAPIFRKKKSIIQSYIIGGYLSCSLSFFTQTSAKSKPCPWP